MKRQSGCLENSEDDGAKSKRRKSWGDSFYSVGRSIYGYITDPLWAFIRRKQPQQMQYARKMAKSKEAIRCRQPELIDLTIDDDSDNISSAPAPPPGPFPQRPLLLSHPIVREKERDMYKKKVQSHLEKDQQLVCRFGGNSKFFRAHRSVTAREIESSKESRLWKKLMMSEYYKPTGRVIPASVTPSARPKPPDFFRQPLEEYRRLKVMLKPAVPAPLADSDCVDLTHDTMPLVSSGFDAKKAVPVVEILDSPDVGIVGETRRSSLTVPPSTSKYNSRWLKSKREEHEQSRKEINASLTLIEQSQRERKVFTEKLEEEVQLKIRHLELSASKPKLPQLTAHHLKTVSSAWSSSDPDKVLVTGFRISMKCLDLFTLRGTNWLNDEVINFYFSLLVKRGDDIAELPSVHAMSTFFYPKLCKAGYKGVQRWTRRADIFSKDLVLFPIHLGMHWCLSVVDFKQKSLIYYDSLRGENNRCLNALADYLCEESLDKRKEEFDLDGWRFEFATEAPEQQNGSDCGVFACQYAQFLTLKRAFDFSQQDMPYFRKRMVYEIVSMKLLD